MKDRVMENFLDDLEDKITNLRSLINRKTLFGYQKRESILRDLKVIERKIKLDEEFFRKEEKAKKKEEKIKKILSKMFIVSGIFAIGTLIESKCISFLPPWALTVAMWCFGIIFILMMVIVTLYEEKN